MRVMFRVWNTEEMEELVTSMREHNRTHPNRPVRFVGYDMQDHRTPIDSQLAFLGRTDPEVIPAVVEAALAAVPRRAGSAGLIVDLRSAKGDAGGAWLLQPRPVRHVGYAAYDYGFDLQGIMPLEFDGLIFIDRTTASRMLPPRR